MIKAHQERVINEKKELDIKLEKLNSFFCTSLFESLSLEEQLLLRQQAIVMMEYSRILSNRIDRFAIDDVKL